MTHSSCMSHCHAVRILPRVGASAAAPCSPAIGRVTGDPVHRVELSRYAVRDSILYATPVRMAAGHVAGVGAFGYIEARTAFMLEPEVDRLHAYGSVERARLSRAAVACSAANPGP